MTPIYTPAQARLQARLNSVTQRIRDAEQRFGRQPGSVKLLAISKTWPAENVATLIDSGQTAFGENYVQEGIEKIHAIAQMKKPPVDWHFIGPLQSNKTREVAESFSWVHSIDRLKTAMRLSMQRSADLPVLKVLVQVNISNEMSKSGCSLPETQALCREIATLPRLQLVGLMAVPAPAGDFSEQREPFHRLRMLFEELRQSGIPLTELSMGMSHDMEAAIAEGSTWVRIGTAIFGERNYQSTT